MIIRNNPLVIQNVVYEAMYLVEHGPSPPNRGLDNPIFSAISNDYLIYINRSRMINYAIRAPEGRRSLVEALLDRSLIEASVDKYEATMMRYYKVKRLLIDSHYMQLLNQEFAPALKLYYPKKRARL